MWRVAQSAGKHSCPAYQTTFLSSETGKPLQRVWLFQKCALEPTPTIRVVVVSREPAGLVEVKD